MRFVCVVFYHRRMTVVKKHHKHGGRHRHARNSDCGQGDAQSLVEGEEVELAGDTDCLCNVGPELRRAPLTLKGI